MNGIANKAKLHSNPIFGAPCGTVVLGICSKSRHAPPIDTKKKPKKFRREWLQVSRVESGRLGAQNGAPRHPSPATHDLALQPLPVMMKCCCLRLRGTM